MLIQVLQWISVVTAFLAAVFWFWSAVVRLPTKYPFGVRVKQAQDLNDAVRKQSKPSAWAAFFAGVSALAAIAMVLNQ
jgi:hypothetical protein